MIVCFNDLDLCERMFICGTDVFIVGRRGSKSIENTPRVRRMIAWFSRLEHCVSI